MVREAVADDVEPWLALFQQVAAEGRWILAEAALDERWAHRSFARTLASDAAVTLVAEVDGTMVGHLGLTVVAGCADLGMMVAPDHRGRGVGSALVEEAIAWCRAHGAHKLALMVFPHNTAAVRLYERHGFVVEGRLVEHVRRANGERWDLVAMGLLLT